MDALIAAVDGREIVRDGIKGSSTGAASLGRDLAERLLANGGRSILAAIYGTA